MLAITGKVLNMYALYKCAFFSKITSVMLAIAVVVRIDAYGVFYCIVLGMMILLPPMLIRPLWLLFIIVHGILLILQYSMLLGVPPGLCFNPNGNRSMYTHCCVVPCAHTVSNHAYKIHMYIHIHRSMCFFW